MRVLTIPYFDQTQLTKSSCFNGMLASINACLDKRKDLYVGLVVPRKGVGGIPWDYDPADFERERLEVIPISAFEDDLVKRPRFPLEENFSLDMFRYLRVTSKKFYWDIVWSANCLGILDIMQLSEHGTLSAQTMIPVLSLATDVPVNSKFGYFVQLKDGIWPVLEILSLMWSWGQVIQPAEKKEVLKAARGIFSATKVKRLKDRCRVIPLPVDIHELLKKRKAFMKKRDQRLKKEGKVKIYYGANFSARKLHTVWASVVSKAKSLTDLDVVVSSIANDIPPHLKDLVSASNMHLNRPYSAYIENLHESDVLLCTSAVITALVPFEATAAGMIPVFLDKPWLDGLVPPDYPYIGSEADLPAMLVYISRNLKQARTHSLKYTEWLVDHYSSVAVSQKLLFLWDEMMEEDQSKPVYNRGSIFQLIKKSVDSGCANMSQVYDFMKDHSETGRDFSKGGQFLSDRLVRKMALNCGVVDLCNSIKPHFKKQ